MADRFRMPAEWEPHAATWIGWPHNKSDWPGKFPLIPWVYGEIVRTLAPGEIVRILVNSVAHEVQAKRVLRKVGVELERAQFLRLATNRGWTRDFGPIFVRKDRLPAELAIARFHFNAWAKYPAGRRHRIPRSGERLKRVPTLVSAGPASGGGRIDVTARSLLTTSASARSPVHADPGCTRRTRAAAGSSGVTNNLWWARGSRSTIRTARGRRGRFVGRVRRVVPGDTERRELTAVPKSRASPGAGEDARDRRGGSADAGAMLSRRRLPQNYAILNRNAAVLAPRHDPRPHALGSCCGFSDRAAWGSTCGLSGGSHHPLSDAQEPLFQLPNRDRIRRNTGDEPVPLAS